MTTDVKSIEKLLKISPKTLSNKQENLPSYAQHTALSSTRMEGTLAARIPKPNNVPQRTDVKSTNHRNAGALPSNTKPSKPVESNAMQFNDQNASQASLQSFVAEYNTTVVRNWPPYTQHTALSSTRMEEALTARKAKRRQNKVSQTAGAKPLLFQHQLESKRASQSNAPGISKTDSISTQTVVSTTTLTQALKSQRSKSVVSTSVKKL